MSGIYVSGREMKKAEGDGSA
jgi:hypothetical protein